MTITAFPEPRFDPLPATNRSCVDWSAISMRLAEQPGQWAAVATTDRITSLRRDRLAVHNLAGVVRSNGDGTQTVWARYLPAPVAAHISPSARRSASMHPGGTNHWPAAA